MEKRQEEQEQREQQDEWQEGQQDERQKERDRQVEDYGQLTLDDGEARIHLLNIIGEIEGHECLPSNSKTTKYEHVIPPIAEMIASLSKPTVSLVLGGSHSIGVPLAVSADYSLIVPTGTMMIHPVRMNGLIIGVAQTFDYFQKIQDRISGFIVSHSRISEERLMKLMLETGELTKDVGSVLVGRQAVDEGLIDGIGGIREAFAKLRELIRMENAGSCK